MYIGRGFIWANAILGLALLSLVGGGCLAAEPELEQTAQVDEVLIAHQAAAESLSCPLACNVARLQCEFDCTLYFDTIDPRLMACMADCRAEALECRADCASGAVSFAPPRRPDDPIDDSGDDAAGTLACSPDAQGRCGNELACDYLCERVSGERSGVCVAGCCYCAVDF